MAAHRVAVLQDGEIIVHMDGDGSYDTLCGVDSNDPEIGLEPADVPLNGRARINCPQCWSTWRESRRYDRKDFTAQVQKERG